MRTSDPPLHPYAVPAPVLAPGTLVVGRYRVVRFIAAGGMGEVYEVVDEALGADIALKTIRPEIARREQAMERFRREILLARRVTHPNVCRIFDLGHHTPEGGGPGVAFLTMELLRGETLDQRLRTRGRMRPEEALPIAVQLAAALTAAHDAGVVHRDFKTANVMLIPPRSAEAAPRAVVTDFGLARLHDAESDTITGSGHLVGTPAYMAPEQAEGGEVTPASDVYALGVVLYEMVTGRLPFVGDSPLSTLLKRFREAPASPRVHVPGLDPRWESVILRCLERDPRHRFATAAQVAAALTGEGAPPARRRLHAPRAVGAGLVVLLLAGAAGYYLAGERGPGRGAGEGGEARPPAVRRSVAVLGFKNLTGARENAWLSTAFAEMLASELSAGERLRTVSGENVARMRIDLSLPEADSLAPDTLGRIRAHVGADLVVLGSYAALGREGPRRIRLDVRVQETAGGDTLAAITETGTEEQMFELVSRAGQRLRKGLGAATLSPAQAGTLRASQPVSAQAARLYAEGLARLRAFDALKARELLEQAVAADPAYAPAHAALAEAWSALGHDGRAAEAARHAFESASGFSREERLAIEGRFREASKEWPRAIELYRSLWTFYPDDLEHGLRLAAAQTAASEAQEARATVAAMRKLPAPASEDPRLDLAEALAAETLGDFKGERELAQRAAAKARERGALLLVARAKLAESWALRHLGQPKEATAAALEARRLYEPAGDRRGVALALLHLSHGLEDQGDLAGARKVAEEAVAINREIGDVNGLARTLNSLANVLDVLGDLPGALRRREESLALWRRAGNRNGVAVATFNIANLMAKAGDHDAAKARYEEALAGFREVGNQLGIASALTGLANEAKERGEFAAARRHYEEALAIDREIGDTAGQAVCHANLAFLALLLGDLRTAQSQYDDSLAQAERAGNKGLVAVARSGMGELAVQRGDLAEARRHHQDALAMRTEMGDEKGAGESRMYLANVAVEEGRAAEAETAARELAEMFRGLHSPEQESLTRVIRARALLARGRVPEAKEEIARARSVVRAVLPPEVRFPLALTEARVRAAAGDTAGATRALEATLAETREQGVVGYALEARLALGEIEIRIGRGEAGRKRLEAVEAEAAAKGFALIARQAAARRAKNGRAT